MYVCKAVGYDTGEYSAVNEYGSVSSDVYE